MQDDIKEIIQAKLNGETVEYRPLRSGLFEPDEWEEMDEDDWDFDDFNEFRVKPEPEEPSIKWAANLGGLLSLDESTGIIGTVTQWNLMASEDGAQWIEVTIKQKI